MQFIGRPKSRGEAILYLGRPMTRLPRARVGITDTCFVPASLLASAESTRTTGLSIRQLSVPVFPLPAPCLRSGGVSQKVVRDGIAGERFEEGGQICLLLRAEAQRSNLLRARVSAIEATLIVEIDHIRQRREPTGVHVWRGLGDVTQARTAKCALIGRILGQRGQLGLSGGRVVAERTRSAKHVGAQAVDRAEPALVL